MSVELATPAGGFETAGTYPSTGSAESVHMVDLSGDGRLDIVVAGTFELSVLNARPDGGYDTALTRSMTGEAGIADIFGDGRLDVLAEYPSASWTQYVLAGGPDGLAPAVERDGWSFEHGMPLFADFDGDGAWTTCASSTSPPAAPSPCAARAAARGACSRDAARRARSRSPASPASG